MDLTLRFFANFREAVGQKTLERDYPDGTTVGDVLTDLTEEYGLDLFEDGDLRSQLSVMKNGTDVVHIDGVDTQLADGDTLSVFPPVAGGSDAAAAEE
ncbi:ubiquitin-like small modifier protein 1 [Halorussus sp. MSC15.2]|uniref:ubiquitin-like small modifier protein 1 n=1 Tax=Halorussus sp. MSC15.2 TaxID=2283638 RepID=UPI0013D0DCA5|nr:ubiquitin-like small modifier protein 1 [Halorussus sp. MSC15.2]NEU55732.1 MoaD/ThiS family protein [Halorussus sp. MSC15.2]